MAKMREYKIARYVAKGILRVLSTYEGIQLWVLTNQPVRKNHKCVLCEKTISKGEERAYLPITNLNNRMDRICVECGKEKSGQVK